LLIAKIERKVRIEVGYGLEGKLTDLLAGRIIDHEITPRFKKGDYDGGITRGLTAIMAAVRGEYKGSGKSSSRKSNHISLIFIYFFFSLLISQFINRLRGRRGRRDSGNAGSGFFIGGGFGGGGGFSGGGGGASGGW